MLYITQKVIGIDVNVEKDQQYEGMGRLYHKR